LMREHGIQGAKRRGTKWKTTTADGHAPRWPDLVARDFNASGPNRLWIADFERHEAPLNRVVMKGHHRRPVAAGRLKLRAA
jgi:putative transposase